MGLLLPGLLWAGNDAPPAQASAQLLRQSGLLFGELQGLDAAREIAREGAPLKQLSIFVSLRPDERFRLESVQVTIDGIVVATHVYSADEIIALVEGGSHHLLVKQLPAGMHELQAQWRGKAEVEDEKTAVRDIRWTFRSGETRRVVELELSQGKEQSFPQFSLREWH